MNSEILDLPSAADRLEHVLPTTSHRVGIPVENGHGSPTDYQATVSLRSECPSPGDRSEKSLSPLIYRADNEGLSATATLINFMKGMVGPGVLSLPIAFKQSGLWTGFVLVFFFGALSTYCMHQLVHCSRQLSKRIGGKPLSYGSVAYETFAHSQLFNGRLRKFRHLARFSVDLTIVVLQVGICCVQYVFIAAHLREIVDQFTNFHVSNTTWCFIIFLPMVLLNLIKTLKTIAILSSIGNVLMFSCFVFIIQHLLTSPHVTSQLPWITDFNGVTTAIGTCLYSFEGQAMVLPMENKLQYPQDMTSMFGVLPTGMALVSIIDAGVGFLGYAKYGQSVEGSITLNLPHNAFFTGIKLVFTLTAFFNFVIQQYVIVDTLLPKLQARLEHRERGLPVKWHLPMEMAFRAGLVVLAATISVLIPNLEEIIPLVGFTAGMMIAFIFPPLFHWVVFTPLIQRGEHPGNVVVEAVKNTAMISVGAFGIFVGLYQTFRSRIF